MIPHRRKSEQKTSKAAGPRNEVFFERMAILRARCKTAAKSKQQRVNWSYGDYATAGSGRI